MKYSLSRWQIMVGILLPPFCTPAVSIFCAGRGQGVKRKTSENQRFSEEFIGLIDPFVTPERSININDNECV